MIIKNLELKIACTKGAQIWLKFSAFFYFTFKSLLYLHCFSKFFWRAPWRAFALGIQYLATLRIFTTPKITWKKHEVKIQRSINLNFKNMRAPKCAPKKASVSKICTKCSRYHQITKKQAQKFVWLLSHAIFASKSLIF